MEIKLDAEELSLAVGLYVRVKYGIENAKWVQWSAKKEGNKILSVSATVYAEDTKQPSEQP